MRKPRFDPDTRAMIEVILIAFLISLTYVIGHYDSLQYQRMIQEQCVLNRPEYINLTELGNINLTNITDLNNPSQLSTEDSVTFIVTINSGDHSWPRIGKEK